MNGQVTQHSALSIDALIALAAGAFVALFISYLLARIAVDRRFILDQPNNRSSHAAPTPRSGGVAIMLGWVVGGFFFIAFAPLLMRGGGAFALIGLTGLATGLGFIDDQYNLPARIKFLGQGICAAGFVYFCGALGWLPLPAAGLVNLHAYLEIIAIGVTVFWIVAFMNAYNFMDGANGIAGICAVITLCGLAAASAFASVWPVMALALILAFALCGFLRLNFPLGTIFMGDSGSHGVAFALAGLAVLAANQSEGVVSALFAPTAMAPFLFDVFFTLAHRFIRGENIFSAHREHLYQLLIRGGRSHIQVTGIYAGLALFSTFIAAGMMHLAPSWQWAAPICLMALFSAPAFFVFKSARHDGLFDAKSEQQVSSGADASPKSQIVR